MNIAVRLEPASATPGDVAYRWDPDTDILTASVREGGESRLCDGSLDIEGRDGSWLVLDVDAGRIHGVEVAVWPAVRRRARLAPPVEVADALVRVPRAAADPVTALEMSTRLAAESDEARRTIHFTVGATRRTRTVRIAREILLDVDERDRIAGVWLLDVPPSPAEP